MQTSGYELCKACPCFSDDVQACSLSSDGIYLPLKHHVATYCVTELYLRCPIYKKHFADTISLLSPSSYGKSQDEDVLPDEAGSRRRYPRIPEKCNVILRSCNALGIVIGDFMERATTVDLSRGGMRVVIKKEPPAGGSLLFDFGNDFLIPHLQGVARACWHRKMESEQCVEVGLVFRDHFSKAILSMELDR